MIWLGVISIFIVIIIIIKVLKLFSPRETLTVIEAFRATGFMSAVWYMKWL